MTPPLTTCERLRVVWFISSRKHIGSRGQIRPTVDIVAALSGHGEFFDFVLFYFSIYLSLLSTLRVRVESLSGCPHAAAGSAASCSSATRRIRHRFSGSDLAEACGGCTRSVDT